MHLLRVNDFPAEPLYAHFVDGVFVRVMDAVPREWTLDASAPAIDEPAVRAAIEAARRFVG